MLRPTSKVAGRRSERKPRAKAEDHQNVKEFQAKAGPQRMRIFEVNNLLSLGLYTGVQSPYTFSFSEGAFQRRGIWGAVSRSVVRCTKGSCPVARCIFAGVITAFTGLRRVDQAATAGSPTIGSSLKGAMVSSVHPFDGEPSASLLSLGLHDFGASTAALLQIGGSNSASQRASEGQRAARSGGRDGVLRRSADGAMELQTSRHLRATFPSFP